MIKSVAVRCLLAASVIGLIGACELSTNILPSTTPDTPQSTPEATSEVNQEEQPDQTLAIMGEDGNIYLADIGDQPIALTDDAQISNSSHTGRLYAHPTWSRGGWLSYVRTEVLPNGGLRSDVVAVRPDEPSKRVDIFSMQTSGYIYGYWSPVGCSDAPDCARLAFLTNDGSALSLHVAEVNSSTATGKDTVAGKGQPFYYSWAPDGNSMLWFRNSQELSIYDVNADSIGKTIADSPGLFQAPAWSPVDQQLLFASAEKSSNHLTILNGDESRELGAAIKGGMYFSWSPDGKKIAFTGGGYPADEIRVINADGSGEYAVKDLDHVVAFFWSPNSKRLAIVTFEAYAPPLPNAQLTSFHERSMAQTSEPEASLVWWVIDANGDTATRLASFLPTPEEFYILQFFDQYAQSHSVWSSDSRYIAYAEHLAGEDHGTIRVIDTQNVDTAPITVMDGRQAIFAYSQ